MIKNENTYTTTTNTLTKKSNTGEKEEKKKHVRKNEYKSSPSIFSPSCSTICI
jgi:hypothetical protein